RRAGPSAVFECKQARPDFLQDSRPEAASLARLTRLHRRRERLERLIGAHYPHLRRGESLFPEYDRTAVTDIAHEGHRKLIAEIRTLEAAVFGRTKFERLVRYRCANFFYLVIRPGILEPAEIPLDWGLLAPDAAAFDAALGSPAEVPALALLREPRFVDAPESHALDLLHRLAVSGTRRLNRESGLTPSRPGNENGEKNTRTQQG
ncbi:MAG: hypothetical protein KDM91_09560, partial [Verrucomicrobiae bacterium]|nr:hypothetical protein [Verrucomicrobiae bacterium]